MSDVPLSEKVRELAHDVDTKIGRLESLRGRVELLETAKGPEWQGKAAPERPAVPTVTSTSTPTIFIVHGHDTAAKLEVHRFLRDVTDHEPVILHDKASRGGTVIEKFERIGGSAVFAVVILTADEEGGAVNDSDLKKRGRQNVVFEFGYFVAKLGRDHTALLYEREVELPSDLDGLVYIELDAGGAWKIALARELREADIDVDGNKIF
jgi:predicted nucleotide-binding protein